ncbi:MAG TPA: glycoside hydrolase family 3 protein [Acidimicrobiales bacterium]|nr:glycoside hydrolase family 3 protein [Acidimicrobiales bacterium]
MLVVSTSAVAQAREAAATSATSATAATLSVAVDQSVYLVDEGGVARVGVTVTTPDGQPLGAAATVGYRAPADAGLSPSTGSVRFAAGTASGSTQTIALTARTDTRAGTAQAVELTVGDQTAQVVVNAHGLPYLDRHRPVGQRVTDLLSRMTLEEKIGQMTQAERGAVTDDPSLIAQWQLGSVLSGGGSTPAENTPAAWLEMVNGFQAQALTTRLQIPMIYGVDAVHGHGNLYGATVFPHNIGLGSTRDPRLVEAIGRATAAEVRATGIPWNFSPCLCVTRDERWGRSYESFGEDPALVASMTTYIDGLQGRSLASDSSVLATAKHFAGDGDTEFDEAVAQSNEGKEWFDQKYTIDQGVTVTNRRDFERIDMAPYVQAIDRRHVGSVMPSFSSVDWTEDGVGNPTKMHANRDLITGRLKQQAGFDGFVISDWEGIHQIPDPADPTNGGLTAYKVRAGVNAGTDMFMEPNTAKQFEDLLLAEVQAGRVSRARIDDAVRRILAKKFELGLFERPFASDDNLDQVGSRAHRALARTAVAKSQVLLKNSRNLLPLAPRGDIYVAGRNADDIGNQAGGWTIQWQGVSGDTIPGTTILEGIRQVAPRADVTFSADASASMAGADVGIVVVGETPYAEGYGDVDGPECGFCSPAQLEEKSLSLLPGDVEVIDKVCGAISKCVVLVVSGRTQVLTDQLGEMDALVASWLPGSEGAGVADVLFGRQPFTGRLSVSWPRSEDQVPINVGDRNYHPLFPYGWGLRT